MSTKPTYRVVLLGDGGVGKSAITLQFTTNQFTTDYDPTIEDAYRIESAVDGEDIVLDILDTAGQEVFSAVREQYMRDGDSFLLVFSLTSKPSLNSLGTIFKQLSRVLGTESTPAVVLGNKSDLIDDREVSAAEGKQLASQYHCSYLETSALCRINIDEAFHEAARLAKAARIQAQEQEKKRKEQQRNQARQRCCIIL